MKRLFIGLTFIFLSTFSFAQTITTLAGNGTAGYTGDGGLGTAANVTRPYDVALDGTGNIYLADPNNNVIRKENLSTGIISTVAGNGTAGYTGDGGLATAAEINFAEGITIDATGNLFIADSRNQVIRRVDAISGIITTVVGNGTFGYTGDGGAAIAAELNNPIDVAVDPNGNLYISDNGNYVIRFVANTTGIISTFAGNGTSGYSGDGGAATSGSFQSPFHICLDQVNDLFVADNGGCSVIRRIDIGAGIIRTVAGNGTTGFSADGLAGISSKLNSPTGVSVDSKGNIYISDYSNSRIRLVESKTGLIKTVAGTGTAGYSGDGSSAQGAKINYPMAVVTDNSNNIYIADMLNNRVRKFNSSTMLPLTLVNFLATTTPIGNTLTWETESEIGTKNFEIQSSENGADFNTIGTLPTKGGGNYSYFDENPVSDRIFYRLKMNDLDGNFTYSPVISLKGHSKSETATINVYPNPTLNYVFIDLNNNLDLVGSPAIIYDTNGKMVKSLNLTSIQTKIDISELSKGIYYLKTSRSSTIKLLKL